MGNIPIELVNLGQGLREKRVMKSRAGRMKTNNQPKLEKADHSIHADTYKRRL